MPRCAWWMLAVLALIALLYFPGLGGGYILDDESNLSAVDRWSKGDISLGHLVFSNGSGPLGRPVSMVSFALTAELFGPGPFGLKLGNLVLHSLNALLVFALLSLTHRALQLRHGSGLPGGALAILALTALWALHPLQVSSVLYAVQRMAILANTGILLTLVFYLANRLRQQRVGRLDALGAVGYAATAMACIFGVLAKENAILALPACLLLEYLCFQRETIERSHWFRALLFAGLAVPLSVLALLIAGADLGATLDYSNRPYSLGERLLTQTRVLFDYIGQILVPRVGSMGLYHDAYPASNGLLSPPSTLIALLAWLGLLALALRLRWRQPAFALGVLLFLCLHLVESTVVPLLLYFEHRNYLASLGVLLAAWSKLASLLSRVRVDAQLRTRAVQVLVVLAMGLLIYQTGGRVIQWGDRLRLWNAELAAHPESRWLRMELGGHAMDQHPPDLEAALLHFRALAHSPRHDTVRIGQLAELAVRCFMQEPVSSDDVTTALAGPYEPFEPDVLRAVENLSHMMRTRGCPGLTSQQFALALAEFADRSTLGEGHPQVWRVRFLAARQAHAGKDIPLALEQLSKAWGAGTPEAPVGVMLAELLFLQGRAEEARKTLDEASRAVLEHDDIGRRRIAELQVHFGSKRDP